MILDIGNYNAILGNAWIDYFDVLLDLRNRKLYWRSPPEKRLSFARILRIPWSSITTPYTQVAHQLEVGRREAAFELEDQRRCNRAVLRVNNP